MYHNSALNSAIYINPESIRYNDLDVRKNAPFLNRRKIDPKTAEEYPDPSSWAKKGDFVTGLAVVTEMTIIILNTH